MTQGAGGARRSTSAEVPSLVARVLTWPFEAIVLAYRKLISPALPQSCRYYPSCSTYALTALRRFGPIVGPYLAARRLVRCHPWCAGGVDHVPPRGSHGLPDWRAWEAQTVAREARWAAVRDDEPRDLTSAGRPSPDALAGASEEVAADRGEPAGATHPRRGMR